jgi:RimJ/RimL family protein N-acetyltransferase
VHLDCGPCIIRSWRLGDAEAIVQHANNRKIWLQLRDRFPHPYTSADAERFLRSAVEANPETDFSIAVGDESVGGIGFTLGTDVERCSAELGYWLGEAFWGRGITTAAVWAATQYAMNTYNLTRVFAVPFVDNAASCRVLEKVGFVREGVMRRSAVKDGRVIDQVLYAFTIE